MFVAAGGAVIGRTGVADPIKPSPPEALALLHAAGVKVAMLTGDTRATAEAVAEQPDRRGLRRGPPEGKAEVVDELRRAGRVVAMAGDGVNNAPALPGTARRPVASGVGAPRSAAATRTAAASGCSLPRSRAAASLSSSSGS